jgi:SAM-dependent methyltransferase
VNAVGDWEPAAAAYDSIAEMYESQVADDAWMRAVLWKQFAEAFKAGDRVLDCGCGTGMDAQFLASLGVRVTAIDVSAAMVDRTSLRDTRGAPGGIHAEVLNIAQLDTRFSTPEFDGGISCFGALNTQASLRTFANDAARLLKPRGIAIIHLLNVWSLWEWGSLISRGRWEAARALGNKQERDFEIGGVTVRHCLWHPSGVYTDFFERHFELRGMYALGVLRPPAGRTWLPNRLLNLLERCDRSVGRYRPFSYWGRFAVLELEKRQG